MVFAESISLRNLAAMKKGDIVLIRASKGEPGVRRVWDPAADMPAVCLEGYWGRWLTNEIDPVCPRVARGQVFQFDAKLAQSLDEAYEAFRKGDAAAAARLDSLWKQARPVG